MINHHGWSHSPQSTTKNENSGSRASSNSIFKLNKYIHSVLIVILISMMADAAPLSMNLSSRLSQLPPGETLPVWVFFHDRGMSQSEIDAALSALGQQYPSRTIERRAKSGLTAFSKIDLPVCQSYLDEVVAITGKIRTVTRYFNGVSVNVDLEKALQIAALPFVKSILPVARGERIPTPHQGEPGSHQVDLNYGESFDQLEQINVIAMHDLGFTGEGVLVCLLDTGYRLEHIAFWDMDIIDTWDFINSDSIVQNEPFDPPGQHDHGTYTLSACGSALEGMLYGPAYEASFLAYKTEMTDDEIPIEEDYYVAGLERADSLGADIVSTSLGYYDWYDFSDLDGNTTVTAIGVDIAVSQGIVCVTAAGNNRNYNPFPYIITPADADSVISCGAVNVEGELAGFSSPGPTYDGRIKPEICAMGEDVLCANPNSTTEFTNVGGTSLSTPLVGGSCALLLQAHPNWLPMMVREALMMTASQAAQPDNDYGWGIIDVLAAAEYSYAPEIITATPEGDTVYAFVDSSTSFFIEAEDEDLDPLTYSCYVNDQLTAEFPAPFNHQIASGEPDTFIVRMAVADLIGFEDDTSWVLIVQEYTSVENRSAYSPQDFFLSAYPNPFNPDTKLTYSVPVSGNITLNIYNITGMLVETVMNGYHSAGIHDITFDASGLPSGVYFARLEWSGGALIQKILLIK